MDLKEIPNLFPDLQNEGLLQEINEIASLRTYEPNQLLMDIGGYIKYIPLLIEGLIKIVKEDSEGNELLLYYLTPGQTCSVSLTCCMANQKSEIKAVVEEPSKMLMIPVHYNDTWMVRYKDWKNFVMNNYRARFEELFQTIDSIAFKKLDDRLISYLKLKVKATNSTIINTTHQEVAYDLNSSREVVSRLLKQLEKQGEIILGRNKIEIINI